MKITGKAFLLPLVLATLVAAVAVGWVLLQNPFGMHHAIFQNSPSTQSSAPGVNGQGVASEQGASEQGAANDQVAANALNTANQPSQPSQPSQPRPDDLLLAEIHASLIMITDQIATAPQYTGAIAMLDVLLAKIQWANAGPRFAALSQAIASDRQLLQAAAANDRSSLIDTLDQLILQVDQLPLINAVSLPPPVNTESTSAISSASSEIATPPTTGKMIWQGVRERLTEVVRIRRVDQADSLLMTEDRAAIMVERLRLRLLSARMALITRQPKVLAQDLDQAEKILQNAFDTASAQGMAAKNTLQSLRQRGLAESSVNVDQSLAQVKRLRAG